MEAGTITTSGYNMWSKPQRVQLIEYPDKIEMVYKQTSNITLLTHPSPPNEVRVYKIIFSCVNGAWHKSEPIFGKVVQPKGEEYDFD